MPDRWTPPTETPETGQGPWCNPGLDRWWVVADSAGAALDAIQRADADVFPIYFGWRAIVGPTCIRWVDPADWNEESEVVECMSNDAGAVEAWRVMVEDTTLGAQGTSDPAMTLARQMAAERDMRFEQLKTAESERDALRRAIVEHRTAIHTAGPIRVRPGYETTAEAKHRADERLWQAAS